MRNHIFVFGNVGAGKSTLMAALAKLFSLRAVLHTNPNNEKGTILLLDWIDCLNDNQFPSKTNSGEIIEIDLGLEFTEDNIPDLQMTFLEMAGEDLIKVDIRKGEANAFEKTFTKYIKKTNAFIIVTDIDRAKKDDAVISQFFNHISSRGADMSLVLLVITKWDSYQDNQDKKSFVTDNMPMSKNWLHSDKIEESQVFTFSIGKVSNRTIEVLNLDDTKKIAEWIYEKLLS